jgi:hypothetical protein
MRSTVCDASAGAPGQQRVVNFRWAAHASETNIRRRLADDPWARTERVVTTIVEPWTLLVGAQRVGSPPAAQNG